MKGVPVVAGSATGALSVGSSALSEVDRAGPEVAPLKLGLRASSTELEYSPLLAERVYGISFPRELFLLSSLDALPPLFRFNRATAEFAGDPGGPFSPNSSLSLNIFFLRSNHVSFIASLSKSEKGRGGCLRAFAALWTRGGRGESGSSMASGEV
jgi:hypothetical protein